MKYSLPCSHPATVDVHRTDIGESRLVQNQNDEVDLIRVDLTENDLVLKLYHFKICIPSSDLLSNQQLVVALSSRVPYPIIKTLIFLHNAKNCA